MIHILAFEKDLFFAVKIRDTLRHHDIETHTVSSLAAFKAGLAASGDVHPALAVINFSTTGVDWEEAILQARSHNCPVLAFGRHTETEAIHRARQAGATRVVANSKFVNDMSALVQKMLTNPAEVVDDDDVAD